MNSTVSRESLQQALRDAEDAITVWMAEQRESREYKRLLANLASAYDKMREYNHSLPASSNSETE